MAKEFLIELGTEELPPKQLRTLAEAFAANFAAELATADIAHEGVTWFATPRRLALKVANLAESQPDRVVEKRGPAVNVAFDADGKPTKAAEGWARGNGITVEQAERLVTDKGEWLLFKEQVQGQQTASVVVEMAAKALANLPIAKPMRWGDKETQFIRPVKTLTILFGSELIKAKSWVLLLHAPSVVTALWVKRNSPSNRLSSTLRSLKSAAKSSLTTRLVKR